MFKEFLNKYMNSSFIDDNIHDFIKHEIKDMFDTEGEEYINYIEAITGSQIGSATRSVTASQYSKETTALHALMRTLSPCNYTYESCIVKALGDSLTPFIKYLDETSNVYIKSKKDKDKSKKEKSNNDAPKTDASKDNTKKRKKHKK